jgi:hypothetical protein
MRCRDSILEVFGDHKFSNINVGETTAAQLLSFLGCALATAGTLYDEPMTVAEELVSCDLDA